MSASEYLYELDETGVHPDNLVTGEQHTLTPSNGENYHFIIPRIGPYFKDSLIVTHVDTGRNLTPEVDYTWTHQFLSASETLEKDVFSSITLLDRNLSGTLSLELQYLGGPFTYDANNLLYTLANLMQYPDRRSWEDVSAIPDYFTPVTHEVHFDDLIGMKEVVDALDLLTEAVKGNGEGNHVHAIDRITGLPEVLAGLARNSGNRKINLADSTTILHHVGTIAVRLPEFERDTKIRMKVIILTEKEPTEYTLSGTIKNKNEARTGETWENGIATFSGYEHTKDVRLSYNNEDVPHAYIGNNDSWPDAKVVIAEVIIDGDVPENYNEGWEVYAANYVSGDAIPAPDAGTEEFHVDTATSGVLKPWSIWLIDSNSPRTRQLPTDDVEDGAEIMVRDYSGRCLYNPATIEGNIHNQNDLTVNRNNAFFKLKFNRTLYTWIAVEGSAGSRYTGAALDQPIPDEIPRTDVEPRKIIVSTGDVEITDAANEYVIKRIGGGNGDILLKDICPKGTLIEIDNVNVDAGVATITSESGTIHMDRVGSDQVFSIEGKAFLELVKGDGDNWYITALTR